MRHDDEAAVAAREEGLERRQPVAVEVVGRLVEQQHVDLGEQDRGQAAPRELAAGQRTSCRGRAPTPAARAARARPRTRVSRSAPPRAATGPARRRRRRRRRRAPAARPSAARVIARLRGGDPGAPREVRPQRLARAPVALLGEQHDAWRPAATRPRVPVSGASSPARTASRVDLPTPLGPTTASRLRGPTVTVTRASTVCGPCEKPTARTSISAADTGRQARRAGRPRRGGCRSVDADDAVRRREVHRGEPRVVASTQSTRKSTPPTGSPTQSVTLSRSPQISTCSIRGPLPSGRSMLGCRSGSLSHWTKNGSAGSSSRSSTPICRHDRSVPSGRRRWPCTDGRPRRASTAAMSSTATTQASQPPPASERAFTAWPNGALSAAGWSRAPTTSR